ncbi:MAG: alpha-glucosidase [Alphaproteobacteria bacterium]|nr:alpha-glucosidase [Alphaproteobacteria bacterium]
MRLTHRDDGFELEIGGKPLIRHSSTAPFAFVGEGEADIAMNRGHFHIEDYVAARVPLASAVARETDDGVEITLRATPQGPPVLHLRATEVDGTVRLAFEAVGPRANRLWLRIAARAGEHVFGGGEQMSYFDMRGRRFPLWTSEPGVGRDKSTQITFEADKSHMGGDYYCTNYPQPTYVSSDRYALHVETTAYSAFDFRHDAFHEIEVWAIPERIEIVVRDDFLGLVEALSARFGRPPPLPDWVLEGAIIGLKEGAGSFARLKRYQEAGVAVSGLWCEDWTGIRQTSFGRRLYWDWRWSAARYPDLPGEIARLAKEGVRFLGYVNPYLCIDGSLYPLARDRGFLALRPDTDEPYIVDFGEFECGIVDFTNPAASDWFAEEVIGREMLDLGLAGWMADFGEYLPHDVRLASGLDGLLAHNAWPTLWAEVNARAVASRGRTGDALFFMRAGFTGVSAYCPLLWAGDQSVDFTRHDGLPSVICGALSSGLLGNAYHHSDVGGYTSLFGNVRTAELIMRWAEMAAFTSVMRTHEGNRPDQNLQVDQDPTVLAHFARMSRVYRALGPYLRALRQEAVSRGLPLQRPLFLHFPDDPRAFTIQSAYLLGPDLLAAPVLEAGREDWSVYLPSGADWIHLWSGARHTGGAEVLIAAPLGYPPVFIRDGSPFTRLFLDLADIA